MMITQLIYITNHVPGGLPSFCCRAVKLRIKEDKLIDLIIIILINFLDRWIDRQTDRQMNRHIGQ